MLKRILFSLSSFVMAQWSVAQPALIPAPASYTAHAGRFVLSPDVAVVAEGPNAASLAPLIQWFLNATAPIGLNANSKAPRSLVLRLVAPSAAHGSEGYTLHISPNGIDLSAAAPAGLFYGLQTLLQMLPPRLDAKGAFGNSFDLPCCTITDQPRFGWRGLMLDVSRHFFKVAEVKQYIDVMAHYKLNVLHWHLTDDEGWRIEIKSLPKLTAVGGCRVKRYGTFGERIDAKPGELATDCGFYTQDDIREVVRYAAERHITIVPEIDVPGHSSAAVASYPELSVTKAAVQVSPGAKRSEWYDDGTFKMLTDNTLNPTDEVVYTFLDKVFGEVAALFPGAYIHSGGDECYHGYWEKDAKVQQFMKAKGLKSGHELQGYFTGRVNKIIASKGKKMMGWDEILEGGKLTEGTGVMSWRGSKGGIEASKLGHPVVMSPTTHCYLDYMQADPSLEPRVYAKLYLKTAYAFDPTPAGVDKSLVLGGQGNLWTEKVPTIDHAFYMTYPRALALAEVLWTPDSLRQWPNFSARTEQHFLRFDAAGISICKALYDPWGRATKQGDATLVTLGCDHPNAVIYYTINETLPTQKALLYSAPFALPAGPVRVKVQAFVNGQPVGRLLNLNREELLQRK
jgi:hexosaminidase